MKRDIYLDRILFTVAYDWDDDAKTNMVIVSICVNGSEDLYDYLAETTIDELWAKLEQEVK